MKGGIKSGEGSGGEGRAVHQSIYRELPYMLSINFPIVCMEGQKAHVWYFEHHLGPEDVRMK